MAKALFGNLPKEVRQCISEFIGTFFLVFTVGLNVLQNQFLAPVSIGMILTVMIFASGNVSGAHFNPAVTIGVLCSSVIPVEKQTRNLISVGTAFHYIIAQTLGGLAASFLYWTLLHDTFTLKPGPGYTAGDAAIVEVLYTTALVFVVLNTATLAKKASSKHYMEFNGMAIGFTVLSAAFAAGSVSGCSLNPAVTIGVMVSHAAHVGVTAESFNLMLLYLVCQLVAPVIAVVLFMFVRKGEFSQVILQQELRDHHYGDEAWKHSRYSHDIDHPNRAV